MQALHVSSEARCAQKRACQRGNVHGGKMPNGDCCQQTSAEPTKPQKVVDHLFGLRARAAVRSPSACSTEMSRVKPPQRIAVSEAGRVNEVTLPKNLGSAVASAQLICGARGHCESAPKTGAPPPGFVVLFEPCLLAWAFGSTTDPGAVPFRGPAVVMERLIMLMCTDSSAWLPSEPSTVSCTEDLDMALRFSHAFFRSSACFLSATERMGSMEDLSSSGSQSFGPMLA
mmetsp:Transcript_85245/g.244783  ORF Transcript_85245/g.244783 Transcript_85245/m.244783 type:complete len:229 (-) Transcript_85245:1414-2100(-)